METYNLGMSETERQRETLLAALDAAVPQYIEQYKFLSWDIIIRKAQQCGEYIAENGDNVIFAARKKGDAQRAFDALAQGLACLAFCPGTGARTFMGHLMWQGEWIGPRI